MNILNDFPNANTSLYTRQIKSKDEQSVKNQEYKPDILDLFSEKVVNKNDINDMVTVPRSIFKGYLCFTAGTAMNAVSGIIKKSAISKCLCVIGSLISIYGTYNFVKPFLIREKDKELTKQEK